MKKRNLKRRRLLSEGGLYRSRVDLFSTSDYSFNSVDDFIENEIRGNEDEYSWAFYDYEEGLTVDDMEINERAVEEYMYEIDRDDFKICIDELSDEVEKVLPTDYTIIVKCNYRRWNGGGGDIKMFDDISEAFDGVIKGYDDVDFYIEGNTLCVDGHHHDATDTLEFYVSDEKSVKRWFREYGDEDDYDYADEMSSWDLLDKLEYGDIEFNEFVDVACRGFGDKLLKTYKFRYTNRENRR